MKRKLCDRFWNWCNADFFSPKDFVRHAILIVLVFAAAHTAGLREYTSFLNGTVGSAGMNPQTAAVLGLIYVLLYLGAVVLAPVLLIAAGLLVAARQFKIRQAAPDS